MRLLYVTDSLAVFGGIEKVLTEKVNFFIESWNYEVTILTVNQGNRTIPYPLNSQVTFVDLDVFFHLQYKYKGLARWWKLNSLHDDFRKKLSKQLSILRPDIILCLRVEYLSDIAKVIGNKPLIFESHSTFWTSRFERASVFRQLHTIWMNFQVRRAKAVVALTTGDAYFWRKINNSVFVIPNLISVNEKNMYSNCLSKSIIFVGRLSKQKDIDSLLKIWALVWKEHSDWILHIYGEKGDVSEDIYQKLLDARNGIVFHGSTSDMHEEYGKHSILLLTSYYEPFGLVLPEAMSCGLPVVSYDCPYGPKDIIIDGIDGFLIKDRNVEQFAERVCQLIEDPKLLCKMSQSAIISSQRYSAKNIIPLWKTLFGSFSK